MSCELIFQTDGNFVMYQNGIAAWNTGTSPSGDALVISTMLPYMKVADLGGTDLWTATRQCVGFECVPAPP